MWALLAVAISACAYYVSTGLGEFWPAAWIAPIPVLVVAFRSSRRTTALAAFAAYLLGSLNLVRYFTMVMPPVLVVMFLVLPALVFAGVVLVARFAVRRLPPGAASFAFPAAWVSYEFLVSHVSPHGTALSLAYSQTDCLPLLQIASVTGIWGIIFVVTLVPSAIAVAWARRAITAIVPAVIITFGVLGYGVGQLQTRSQGAQVRAGLAATDQGLVAAFATDNPAVALATAHAYANRVARLAAAGAQVIVLPEKFVGVTPADSDAIQEVFSAAARAGRVTLIAGFNRFTPAPPRNEAVVFAPDGRVILQYEKHSMLPGPETGYEIGGAPGLFPASGAQWGVAICKDMDYPSWLRGYGQRGVRILAVPAWDFVIDGRLRSRMALVRGVEEGFTMARVAQQGRLTFSDTYGRILGETSSSRTPDAVLVANIPVGPGATTYTRFGDWFGWLCAIGLAALVGAASRLAQ